MFDVIIIGAGPAGLSASQHAKELGLKYICLEREKAANTLHTYPKGKDIHYYPANVQAVGKLPLPEGKADDTLRAWQDFAKHLNVKEHEEVMDVKKEDSTFKVTTTKGSYESKFLMLAIGVQGTVRKVPIDCDDEKKILYHIPDVKAYKGRKMLVVGGGDTAIEYALLLKEAGTDVTISYRKPEFFRLKDVNAQGITSSGIPIIFNSNVECFRGGSCRLEVNGEKKEMHFDFIAIFAGTIPATDFLAKIGLKLENNKPGYTATFESIDILGLYIAGDLTKQPLIKPAINHGVLIIDEIKKRL
jgi:thioredoxin reductase